MGGVRLHAVTGARVAEGARAGLGILQVNVGGQTEARNSVIVCRLVASREAASVLSPATRHVTQGLHLVLRMHHTDRF